MKLRKNIMITVGTKVMVCDVNSEYVGKDGKVAGASTVTNGLMYVKMDCDGIEIEVMFENLMKI
jgi:hypothetical protein